MSGKSEWVEGGGAQYQSGIGASTVGKNEDDSGPTTGKA